MAAIGAQTGTGFMDLPNAAEIGPNEDLNMVRVEVPRSAMIALGLEVGPEQAWQPVQADVMLGADGLARAVRFLEGFQGWRSIPMQIRRTLISLLVLAAGGSAQG